MKTRILCGLTAIGLLLSTGNAWTENVLYRDLPDQVRKGMQKHRDDLDRIERFTHNGRTVYEVQLEKGGFIYFGEDGNRLTDPSLRNQRLAATGKLKLNNLPAPVQKTFRQQAAGATASDIQIDSLNGRNVYDIQYTRNGQTDHMRINQDGSMASGERASRRGFESREQRETTSRNQGEISSGFDRPLAATQKVDFENIPEAVKRTARNLAGSNRIEDTERGRLDGKTVYEIAFKKDGQHNEVRVAEDGSVLQRVAGTNIRFPGALTVDEVPAPVRRAIQNQVGSGEVNDIDKKTVDGKTVYEVGFKKQSGGAQHEIQIAEDGTVIGEPAGAGRK
jgi:uncharacterized membrane protein YkoI